MYQGLTIYLLIAIGWHGGRRTRRVKARASGHPRVHGPGVRLNFFIGILAYFGLAPSDSLREVDKATVAGYYGSDSAGTFVTCVGVLAAGRSRTTPTCR